MKLCKNVLLASLIFLGDPTLSVPLVFSLVVQFLFYQSFIKTALLRSKYSQQQQQNVYLCSCTETQAATWIPF